MESEKCCKGGLGKRQGDFTEKQDYFGMQKNYESLQVTFTFEIYFDQLDKGMRIQSQTL